MGKSAHAPDEMLDATIYATAATIRAGVPWFSDVRWRQLGAMEREQRRVDESGKVIIAHAAPQPLWRQLAT